MVLVMGLVNYNNLHFNYVSKTILLNILCSMYCVFLSRTSKFQYLFTFIYYKNMPENLKLFKGQWCSANFSESMNFVTFFSCITYDKCVFYFWLNFWSFFKNTWFERNALYHNKHVDSETCTFRIFKVYTENIS